MKRQILFISLILSAIQTLALGTIWDVPSRGIPDINTAISMAVDGDVIRVAKGTWTGPNNRGLDLGNKKITIMSNINIANPDPATIAGTIIDCSASKNDPNRAFWIHGGQNSNNTKIIGFTIKNGYQRGPQGANGRFGTPTPVPFVISPSLTPDTNTTPPYAENGSNAVGNGFLFTGSKVSNHDH